MNNTIIRMKGRLDFFNINKNYNDMLLIKEVINLLDIVDNLLKYLPNNNIKPIQIAHFLMGKINLEDLNLSEETNNKIKSNNLILRRKYCLLSGHYINREIGNTLRQLLKSGEYFGSLTENHLKTIDKIRYLGDYLKAVKKNSENTLTFHRVIGDLKSSLISGFDNKTDSLFNNVQIKEYSKMEINFCCDKLLADAFSTLIEISESGVTIDFNRNRHKISVKYKETLYLLDPYIATKKPKSKAQYPEWLLKEENEVIRSMIANSNIKKICEKDSKFFLKLRGLIRIIGCQNIRNRICDYISLIFFNENQRTVCKPNDSLVELWIEFDNDGNNNDLIIYKNYKVAIRDCPEGFINENESTPFIDIGNIKVRLGDNDTVANYNNNEDVYDTRNNSLYYDINRKIYGEINIIGLQIETSN